MTDKNRNLFGVLPVEIKYVSSVKRNSLKSLAGFVKDDGLPMALLVNQGKQVEWITPEIVQVPVGWL